MDALVGCLRDAGFQVDPDVEISLQSQDIDLAFVNFATG